MDLTEKQKEMKTRWSQSRTKNQPEMLINLEVSVHPEACKTYFIQGVKTGLIKIGKTSRTVKERCGVLQVGSPDKLRILGEVASDIEDKCHALFAHLSKHGEWFRPAPELLEFIDKL